MKVAAKFLISLVLALLLAWAVRTYVFTIFTVPQGGLPPHLKAGNRVIVNRIDCENFSRGETIVFDDTVALQPSSLSSSQSSSQPSSKASNRASATAYFIGTIEKLPGDTLTLDTLRYVIPTICCKRCGCKDCRYYLVRTSGGGKQLVHKHQIIGKAYKLF